MNRPNQKAVHRPGNAARLALRLVGDWRVDSDRAASIAACVDGDDGSIRVNWLACVLPLPVHADRVDAATRLLRECGYAA